MQTLETLLLGAIAMGSLVAALFFLRFWARTRDTFFLFFSAAFFIEAISRLVLALEHGPEENEPLYYFPRLIAFSLIALAVVLKNRPHSK
jgi:uncharacterized membrane protein HdeD (DUF308 family)